MSNRSTIAHLVDGDVRAFLDPRSLIDDLEQAFIDLAHEQAATTVRVRAAADGAMASAMAAAVPRLGITGGKVYATVDGRFTFHVVLFDLDGAIQCTMDGAALTEARTAALSAVVARRVLPQLGGAQRGAAAVIGTGRECLPHLDVLAAELGYTDLRVWGRTPDKVASVVAAARRADIPASAADSVAAATEDTELIVTVTSADEPVLLDGHVAPGTLICAVGATKPQRCELDPALFGRARLIVTDSLAGAPHESGDLIHAVAAGTTTWSDVVDLPALLAGRHEIAPQPADGLVIFESQGVAIQDVVAAASVWRAYSAANPT